MTEALATTYRDQYEVTARVSMLEAEGMGAEFEPREGVRMLAAALLGDDAWKQLTLTVPASSHEDARERALEWLLAAGHDVAEVIATKRLSNFELPAQILDCTTAEYHADPCPEPSISGSMAKVLDKKAAAHAYLTHPRLGGRRSHATKIMDKGSLFHALLLGKGAEIVEVPHKDWRTNDAKAQRDAARAAGKLAVLTDDLAEVREAVTAAREALAQVKPRPIVLDGQSEVPIVWRERVFGTEDAWVWARCMVDHLTMANGRLTIYEVKGTEDAHPDACVRTILNLGYHISAAAYVRAVEALYPEWAGRVDFVFLFCELSEPFVVTPLRLDGQFRAIGEARWDRAVRTFHQCMTEGKWPGYTQTIDVAFAPAFALTQAAEQGISL